MSGQFGSAFIEVVSMRRCAHCALIVAVVGAVLTGCAEKTTPVVQAPVQDTSQDRIRELERQLNEAASSSARDRDQIAALQNELAQLRKRLSERPAATPAPAPGWNSVPGGAMTSIEGTILFDSGKA